MRNDNPDINEDDINGDIEVGGIDNFETFIPDIGNTNAPSTGESRNLTIPFSLVEHRPQLLMPYKPTEVTRGALENCIQAYFDDTDAPTYDGFLQYLRTNEDSESPSGSDTTSKTARGAQSCVASPTPPTATSSTTAQTLPDVSNAVFREGQVTVIPTSHLHGAKEELTVLSILSYIIDNKIDDYNVDPNVKDTPTPRRRRRSPQLRVRPGHPPRTIHRQPRPRRRQTRPQRQTRALHDHPKPRRHRRGHPQTNQHQHLPRPPRRSHQQSPSIPRGYEQDLQNTAKDKPSSKPQTSKLSKSEDFPTASPNTATEGRQIAI